MKIVIVLAHPDKKSFNHAIAETALEALTGGGHTVVHHDLYDEKFDPLLTSEEILKDADLPEEIRIHCEELKAADGIVIVHPNWWGQPPAILKGWIDRVIRPGVAYEFLDGDEGEGVPNGLLKGKRAVVFNTSNTPAKREVEVFGDPLELLWRNCIFGLCGISDCYRRMFNVIVESTETQRRKWLAEVRDTCALHFPGGNGKDERLGRA